MYLFIPPGNCGLANESYIVEDGIGKCNRMPLSRQYWSHVILEKKDDMWEIIKNRFGHPNVGVFIKDEDAENLLKQFLVKLGYTTGVDWSKEGF